MYEGNYLAQRLRASSSDGVERVFAKKLDGSVITYQAFFDGAEATLRHLYSKG